jgi:hypothetical protein
MRTAAPLTDSDKDIIRKRDAKSKGAAVSIPLCVNPDRRQHCLEDPQLFLKTYFPDRFYNPFASHHVEMINAIANCATDGGSQALAAPRGDGKTEICLT